MAQYTIEDIEILRQKSGISYEEAVNLLEYHNGSLARALVDMEKNGRIKSDRAPAGHKCGGKRSKSVLTTLYRFRIKISKDNVVIANLSAIYLLLVTLFAPWVIVLSAIAAFVLGYRIHIDRNCDEFDSFDDVVRNASSNVKRTVASFTAEFSSGKKPGPEGSFYRDSTDSPRAESAPSGTTPVNVQFPGEGNVQVKDDNDGYHEADIQ